jgi:adenosylmethionine-8-amino-7-oxononanoate aminotransferase
VLKTDPPHLFRSARGLDAAAAETAAIDAARELIAEHRDELAALVVEPMMQGAAGMWNHSANFLRALTAMAREAGALVVFDEVAVGFGRTGKMFACEHAGVAPDLMCLGKGITGGYLPLAATLATEAIFDAFLGEPNEYRAFYYGHTYTGNPLAAAAAFANLGIFRDEQVIDRVQARIEQLRDGLARHFGNHPHIADIRQTGLMVGLEMMEDPIQRVSYPAQSFTGARIARAVCQRGVAIRPLGDVIVLMPPLSVAADEVDLLLAATHEGINEITSSTA